MLKYFFTRIGPKNHITVRLYWNQLPAASGDTVDESRNSWKQWCRLQNGIGWDLFPCKREYVEGLNQILWMWWITQRGHSLVKDLHTNLLNLYCSPPAEEGMGEINQLDLDYITRYVTAPMFKMSHEKTETFWYKNTHQWWIWRIIYQAIDEQLAQKHGETVFFVSFRL